MTRFSRQHAVFLILLIVFASIVAVSGVDLGWGLLVACVLAFGIAKATPNDPPAEK